jgi:nucleotide-binding universal stress UspA family protein
MDRRNEMQEKILVPLDGSEVGEAVLPKLEDLILRATPKMDVEVTLLRVISKMNFNMLTDDEAAQLPADAKDLEQLTQEAQLYLDSVADGLKSKDIKVKTLITTGNTANEIVKAAREIKAHLIAMATHGRSGVVRWAIGSVTDKVMRLEGSIPVLTVKASGKEESTVIPMKSLNSLMKHT